VGRRGDKQKIKRATAVEKKKANAGTRKQGHEEGKQVNGVDRQVKGESGDKTTAAGAALM